MEVKKNLSIHPYGRRAVSTTCTKSPRSRPGKLYPGGKTLRRALAKLAMRRTMREQGIDDVRRERPEVVAMMANVPGSMTK